MTGLLDSSGVPLPPQDNNSAANTIDGVAVMDSDTAGFEQDVLIQSQECPVIIDMWSENCGPCKQLMPLLEKVVTSYNGAIRLVKINADENPQICQVLQIQSLPTILAFYKGQPVDGFTGYIPEPAIRQFVDALLKKAGIEAKKDIAKLLQQAEKSRNEKNFMDAENLYWQILEQDAMNTRAFAGLGHCYLDNNDISGAREFLKSLSPELYQDEAIMEFRNRIKLMEEVHDDSGLQTLEKDIEDNPSNHPARLELADKYYALNQYDKAFSVLLQSIEADAAWHDGAAKAKLFELFNHIGHSHPAVAAARRQLSGILFR